MELGLRGKAVVVGSTMLSSTTFSSSKRRVQRAKPSGVGEQAKAISLAYDAPSKIRRRAEFGVYLRTSVASNPSSTSCRRTLPTVLRLVSNAAAISRSVQPSPASEVSAFSRIRAFVISCADRLPEPMSASSRSRSCELNLPRTSRPPARPCHESTPSSPRRRDHRDSEILLGFKDAYH